MNELPSLELFDEWKPTEDLYRQKWETNLEIAKRMSATSLSSDSTYEGH